MDAVKMSIKLALLIVAIIVTTANCREIRTKSGDNIYIDIEIDENLATLRQKLQIKCFPTCSDEFWFLNVKHKRIPKDNEEDIPVAEKSNNPIFVDIKANTVKVCLNDDMNRCKDVHINDNTNLKNVRDALMEKKFIHENNCEKWRFIDSKVQITKSGGELSVKQAFIKDKSIESDLSFDNFIVNNHFIPMINYYDINLETVYVLQGLVSNKIYINPGVNLNWLRTILSENVVCSGSVWKGPARPIFNAENEQETWRVIYRSQNTANASVPAGAKVSPDLIMGRANEMESTVSSVVFVGAEKKKYIDYSNIKSKKVDLVGMFCNGFRHQNKYTISVYDKYPTDKKFSPIMLSDVRSVNEKNRIYDNIVVAENGTAIGIKIEHDHGRKMIIEIKHNNKTIVEAIGNYFSFYADGLRDIILIKNVIMNERADLRQQKQTITVIIKPVISYKYKNGEYKWDGQRKRRAVQGGAVQGHIPEDGVNQAEVVKGAFSEANKFSPDGYYDPKFEEPTQFTFYIFNFRSHEIAEKLLSIQPADPF